MSRLEKIINPKKELFRWGPIEFRLFYGSFFHEVYSTWSHELYPWGWPPVLEFYENNRVTFVLEESALRDVGTKYFKKYFLNTINFKRHWKLWQQWLRSYKTVADRFDVENWQKVSNQDLAQAFRLFYEFNLEFWLIVHVPEVANWGGEQMLLDRLTKINPERAKEYLEVLSAPVKFSFFQQEQIDLLNIGLIADAKKRDAALEQHVQNYAWLLNSYGGNRILDKRYFGRELKQLLLKGEPSSLLTSQNQQIVENKKRQARLLRTLQLSQQTRKIAEGLRQSIWWQDLRKGYIWRMHTYWDAILQETARRHGWTFEDIVWCYPEEVAQILEGSAVNRLLVQQRHHQYAVFANRGKREEWYGSQAKAIMQKYEHTIPTGTERFLKGLVVSRGNGQSVTGTVRIIRNPFKELQKMKLGDILVAPMTSPEFIVVMKKAAAIVTDQGGMTSHAAVVSRELGIPCIVNTKFATQVLKDGQQVVVDVANGTIRQVNGV